MEEFVSVRDRGFKMPPEWAPHAATWLSWPHNLETWPDGQLASAEAAMASAVHEIAAGERLRINVLDAAHGAHVAELIGDTGAAIELHEVPTDDAWVRDHGAIFVHETATRRLVALDFDYNAWGGKYPPYDRDRRVAARMAEIAGVESVTLPMVLEGGSIEVNGEGLLLTTEQCLLNPNRNPALDRDRIESNLRDALGVDEIVWLGDGIEGDDTDGHVDDLTRFVDARTLVTVVEEDVRDSNHAPLAANRRRLESIAASKGLEIVELPMPEPRFGHGQRLPASYANFYIANACVLVPVFACPQDDVACARIEECFPDRRIVPIDASALVVGLGALHCLTQQQPAIVAETVITYS